MSEALKNLTLFHALAAFILLFAGIFIARRIANIVEQQVAKRLNAHQTSIVKRILYYTTVLIFVLTALDQIGIDITVLLSAAGVLTVALSFASKTSASNLVSGIFLLIEHPFKVGDFIKAKGYSGKVESIDLLSTKIRTPDNTLVRLPNESLIQTEITNLSYFKTRRADLLVDVDYDTNLDKAMATLVEIAANNSLALKDPAPKVSISEFKDSAIELKYSVWTKSSNVTTLQMELKQAINRQFKQEGINIPFPQLVIHKGS